MPLLSSLLEDMEEGLLIGWCGDLCSRDNGFIACHFLGKIPVAACDPHERVEESEAFHEHSEPGPPEVSPGDVCEFVEEDKSRFRMDGIGIIGFRDDDTGAKATDDKGAWYGGMRKQSGPNLELERLAEIDKGVVNSRSGERLAGLLELVSGMKSAQRSEEERQRANGPKEAKTCRQG